MGAKRIILAAGLAVVAVTPSWAPATAQVERSISSSAGVFRAHFPDVELLLDALDRGHAILYARLLDTSGAAAARTDDRIYDELLSVLRQPGRTAPVTFSPAMSRADEAVDRATGFRRQVYEILADPSVVDRVTAVERATDDYLRQSARLPGEPKSLELIAPPQEAHDHSRVVGQDYPKVRGLIRAYQWLELALCEPLIAYDTAEDRRAGVAATVSRFQAMLESPPDSMPSEMPTAPAIAPGFAQRHPRAAAIFDNAHVLQHLVADVLTGERPEPDRAIQTALETLTDPQRLIVSRDDWVLTSLRRGIWWQGGPAIGTMDEPERNRRIQHAEHGRMPLPGMGDIPAELQERPGSSQPRDQKPAADPHAQH